MGRRHASPVQRLPDRMRLGHSVSCQLPTPECLTQNTLPGTRYLLQGAVHRARAEKEGNPAPQRHSLPNLLLLLLGPPPILLLLLGTFSLNTMHLRPGCVRGLLLPPDIAFLVNPI